MVNSQSPTAGGARVPDPSNPDFGKSMGDFPRNANWKSPFEKADKNEIVTLFGRFELEFKRPGLWTPFRIPGQPSCKFAIASPDFSGTLMIAADELIPQASLEFIAGDPFLKLLKHGARSPLATTFPIRTEEGDSGYMVSSPLMMPGVHCGRPDVAMIPMFKHTVVIAKDGHWFSFETQSWGVDLDIAKEVTAQTEMYRSLKIRVK